MIAEFGIKAALLEVAVNNKLETGVMSSANVAVTEFKTPAHCVTLDVEEIVGGRLLCALAKLLILKSKIKMMLIFNKRFLMF